MKTLPSFIKSGAVLYGPFPSRVIAEMGNTPAGHTYFLAGDALIYPFKDDGLKITRNDDKAVSFAFQDGTPAMDLIALRYCDDIAPGDAMAKIDEALRRVEANPNYFREQIAGLDLGWNDLTPLEPRKSGELEKL